MGRRTRATTCRLRNEISVGHGLGRTGHPHEEDMDEKVLRRRGIGAAGKRRAVYIANARSCEVFSRGRRRDGDEECQIPLVPDSIPAWPELQYPKSDHVRGVLYR